MDTHGKGDALTASLFSKTRRAVLGLLYGHVDEAFYLRQIARVCGGGLGAVQRELAKLSGAGILRRTVRGPLVFFQADPNCPVFDELKSIIVKTAGTADVIRAALAPLANRIGIALVYGSTARGEQTRQSDVDLLVVGDVAFSDVLSALAPAQETLRREVNPTVYPPDEFRSKVTAGQHFLCSVVKEAKVFVIGDERELAGLAQKRVAD